MNTMHEQEGGFWSVTRDAVDCVAILSNMRDTLEQSFQTLLTFQNVLSSSLPVLLAKEKTLPVKAGLFPVVICQQNLKQRKPWVITASASLIYIWNDCFSLHIQQFDIGNPIFWNSLKKAIHECSMRVFDEHRSSENELHWWIVWTRCAAPQDGTVRRRQYRHSKPMAAYLSHRFAFPQKMTTPTPL